MNSYQSNPQEELINLIGIDKYFDRKLFLKDISLQIRKGEFVSIVGPSGCGKSTILNILTGLISPDQGRVEVKDSLGYMQQKDLLLPWKTVLDNVILPLTLQGIDKKASVEKAKRLIPMMGLSGVEYKFPHQLSGGMRQRVSFLRTVLASDKIMLLDEPFGALDAITKSMMQHWLLDMKEKLQNTIVMITHDIEEAIFLSDRIYVMGSQPGTVDEEVVVRFYQNEKRKRLLSQEMLIMKERILERLQHLRE